MNKNRKQLIEAVNNITSKYKEKDFNELKKLIKNPDYFTYDFNDQTYSFEIEAKYLNDNFISVCIGGQRNKMFTIGFAKYFGKTSSNELIENNDKLVF